MENDFWAELKQKREQMRDDWQRVLPSNELLFDRWEKARFVSAGQGSSIYDSCMLLGEVKIGENTWVGPNTLLDGSGGGLFIGDGCQISAGVQIYTHDSVMNALSGGKLPIARQSTSIGNNCYIAPQSVIAKGVSLGDCCVVATMSFVNKSFPARSIIAGTPAKRIGEVIFTEDNIHFSYFKNSAD